MQEPFIHELKVGVRVVDGLWTDNGDAVDHSFKFKNERRKLCISIISLMHKQEEVSTQSSSHWNEWLLLVVATPDSQVVCVVKCLCVALWTLSIIQRMQSLMQCGDGAHTVFVITVWSPNIFDESLLNEKFKFLKGSSERRKGAVQMFKLRDSLFRWLKNSRVCVNTIRCAIILSDRWRTGWMPDGKSPKSIVMLGTARMVMRRQTKSMPWKRTSSETNVRKMLEN